VTGTPAAVALRGAKPADAEPLARCQLACWREAYAGLVEPARLDAVLAAVDQRIAGWRQILAADHGTVLAEDQGELLGFASAGPGRDPDLDLTTELYAIYARRSSWGRGVGHRLLTAAVGDADSFLWVFRDNLRARDFYTRHGYRPDGSAKDEPHFGGLEIRMVRRGGTASPAR
jgi:GNAT superfamily N-acetyltransferase